MRKFILIILLCFVSTLLQAQEGVFADSKISGNFQVDMQSYTKDSLIGASDVDEKVLSNGFLWLNYTSNNFNAAIRYENYLNPMLGIDKRYQGSGIAFRYAEFTSDIIDVTAGNFYEQFGSGMILRSYQEYALGLDNAMDGLRMRFRPVEGIELKALIGKQRKFWTTGDGIVRGVDLDLNVNDAIEGLLPDELRFSLGGGVVSKFQKDLNSTYNLPQNVLMWAGRFGISTPNFLIDAEYSNKCPDPASANDFNFNPGNALLVNTSYFTEGFGASMNFHRNDNMDIRSDRNELGNTLLINFLPPLTKQHAYSLAAMYPYATQLNGEIGYQAELTYTIPRRTTFGGRYGTTLNLNYSQVNSIPKNSVYADSVNGEEHIFTYDSPFLKFGDRTYFRELNFEVTRKFSSNFKLVFTYLNQLYDRDRLEVEGSAKFGHVRNNILIADMTFKLSSKLALRTEFQQMFSEQDSASHGTDKQYGDWFAALAELTISPNWYISVTDQWNYGNDNDDYKIHYLMGAVTYVFDATRFSLGYGRQREGIICVGGVCRQVPASNGFNLSISSSF
jgi:hypothetical protein